MDERFAAESQAWRQQGQEQLLQRANDLLDRMREKRSWPDEIRHARFQPKEETA